METDEGEVYEWRIENLSHWCAEVHGHCIRSHLFYTWSHTELYPKGIGGKGEHLVVRLCHLKRSFSGDISLCSSDGSLLCPKQQVKANWKDYLELPPGPKFEDVLSRIRESEDFIAVKLREHDGVYSIQRMSTTVNVLKISVKINPTGVETIKSGETEYLCVIPFSPDVYSDRMEFNACFNNDIINFVIHPTNESEHYPFAVEMCMSLTGSDDNAVNCLKKENVFRGNIPWTFPYQLQKKDVVGKEISLFLWVKTKNLIQSFSYGNYDCRNISVELNNISCFSEKAPSTALVTPDKVSVLTKDSGTQTSVTSELAYDSVLVLSKELICVYQDQKFSDLVLKCDNVTFPVHKVILSARSPVLDRLLSSDMKETASGTVDIGDLDPSTLGLFLNYLYTGAVEELQCERALKLYYAADKYQVPSLKKDCSKFLCGNVSISNVCDILSLANRHQDDELTAVSHVFILDNFITILKSKEWNTLKKNEPLLVADTLTQFALKERLAIKDQPQ